LNESHGYAPVLEPFSAGSFVCCRMLRIQWTLFNSLSFTIALDQIEVTKQDQVPGNEWTHRLERTSAAIIVWPNRRTTKEAEKKTRENASMKALQSKYSFPSKILFLLPFKRNKPASRGVATGPFERPDEIPHRANAEVLMFESARTGGIAGLGG
jgi:hypothetical protein